MTPFHFLAIVAHFLFTLGVNAGNRAWEPTLKPRAESVQITVRDVSGAHDVYGNKSQVGVMKRADIARQYTRSHASTHGHEKRWFGLPSSREAGAPYLWPQGNIRACFENAQHMHDGAMKTTEQILSEPLQGARELWRQAGLDDKNGWFHFDVITNNPTYCSENNRNDRHEFLLIKYAGEGVRTMATSTGMPAELDPSPDRFPEPYTFDELGPRMILSDDPDMGQKNVVANFAHEMGHAWGLHHEHQNPIWWERLYSGTERSKWFFGTDSWICENLDDYEDAVAEIRSRGMAQADEEQAIADICLKYSVAAQYKFSGFNYLPILLPFQQWDQSRQEPDWDSIMLYPSDAGGRPANGGGKAKILFKNRNGDEILPVVKPSQRDVAGLRKMYSAPGGGTFQTLLVDARSIWNNKFKTVRRQDPDAHCT
ncbi:hypothetical protein B0H63DRAFT_445088 [Podospora didyma]|uniref:Peptidase M12A domain-containing protein n=1 Tax=Podospora didyma TaxID=330526 RepID=A0AAE0P819_9PEZI|nr:hypothetical protein B0H63DRAFT_445088 [Podospora didyma]